MRHTTGSVFGIFKQPVHMYRGTVMAGIIQDEAIWIPSADSPAASNWRLSRWGCRLPRRF